MMRTHKLALYATPLLLLALAACHRPTPARGRRAILDDIGRTVLVPPEPRRLISLAPSSTEILYAIGAGDRLVGIDRYSDWPKATASVAKVGANLDPSLERILGLRPDLVFITTSANTEATDEGLAHAGIPVFVSRARKLSEIYADIEAIGGAVGREEAARALTASMRARFEKLRARWAGRPPVRTLVVVWPDPLVVASRTSHLDDLITLAGGINVADDSTQPFPTYSLERLLARAPEVILVGSHAAGAPAHGAFERLTAVPAVRDHRVYSIDGNLIFRPGPRVVEGAEAIARLLHPDEAGAPK